MMRKIFWILAIIAQAAYVAGQGRNINKLTLETTYSYAEINKTLRDLVDANRKEMYFSDDFFNGMLKKILSDKQFTNKEKVQLFYLMQKKLGYAFVGVNYLPPKQNYFIFHLSKIHVFQKTKETLQSLAINAEPFLEIADAHKTNDPIVSANALLLASLINTEQVSAKMRTYTDPQIILQSKNPAIFNHYVCLSASLLQDSVILRNLKKCLTVFKQEAFIEDVFCALYAKNNPLSIIKEYILHEKNPENDLSIETALCALNTKVPPASFQQSVKSLIAATTEQWKIDLLDRILAGQIPHNYSLTSDDQLVPKIWDYVQISIYNDGTLISNNTLLEFDPN
jgi:hypothetical protein